MKKKFLTLIAIITLLMPFNVFAIKCSECSKLGNSSAIQACEKNCEKPSAYDDCVDRCNKSTNGSDTSLSACIKQCENKDKTPGSGSSSSSNSGSGAAGAGSGSNATSSQNDDTVSHETNIKGTTEDDLPKTTCETLFGGKFGEILKDIYGLIKFLVPLLLIAMSIKDFGTVIIKQDNDGMKKATTTFIKRFIIALVVLLAPTIIGYILKLLGVNVCLV